MRALADTTALLADSLAAYSYVRDTKSTADNYAGSYLIRRGRPDTNHRFRVRGNPSGAWVETDIGTPVALPAPVTPSTPGLLSQNNCRHAYASCSPPGQPEADLIYSGNRISVQWTVIDGGYDANNTALPASSARVVDASLEAEAVPTVVEGS